jgi:hypothetical protein
MLHRSISDDPSRRTGMKAVVLTSVVAVSLLVTGASSRFEETAPGQDGWEQSVGMTLSTPTLTVAPGQAIALKVTLTNTSGVELSNVPRRLRDDLRLKITRGAAPVVAAIPERWVAKSSIFQPMVTIKPGNFLAYSFILHMTPGNPGEFLFKDPGPVVVQARLLDGQGTTVQTSAPLTVTVRALTPAEVPVFNLLNALQNRELLSVWPSPDYMSSDQIAQMSQSLAQDVAKLNGLSGIPAPYQTPVEFLLANANHFAAIAATLVDNNGRQLPEYAVVDEGKLNTALASYDKLATVQDEVYTPQILGMFMLMGLTGRQPLEQRANTSAKELLKEFSHTDYTLGQWGSMLPLNH